MKQTLLTSCLVVGMVLIFGVNEQAHSYGINITMYDGKTSSSPGGGRGLENNETEPGMVQSQIWDLEGFFLDGTTLTMIGGFNFLTGVGNYKSGDIFISTDSSYGYDAAKQTTKNDIAVSGNGYEDYSDNFGYEYVLDINWVTMEFDFLQLNANSTTKTAYYPQNELGNPPTSNPFQYVSGETGTNGKKGTVTGGSSVDDSGFTDWEGTTDNTHYAVSFDLSPFLSLDQDLYFHFTMGCGNDNLMGHSPVPEPATMLLFGTGLIGLAGIARRRNKKK